MDTIDLKFITKNPEDLQTLEFAILDHKWCKVTSRSSTGLEMTVKLSYPRAFESTNAFLITTSKECLEVHKKLINSINEYGYQDSISIKLTRVDIPFTYLMDHCEDFNSYSNIFRYMSEIYYRSNPRSDPKSFESTLTQNKETYIMANTSNARKADNKLTIYNQYKRFQDTHYGAPINCPDLKYRIRLEVCKRIRRKEFTLEEFKYFNIFREYFYQYKDYILHNALDLDILKEIQAEEVEHLRYLIRDARKLGSFSYKSFIYENLHLIRDFKVLREAMKGDLTSKSLENAVTTARKVIKEIEGNRGIIIMDTYKKFNHLRDVIFNKYI